MSMNIVSLNVRGFKDPLKRRSIFNYYRKRANVLCLQETHSEIKDEQIWANEYGGEIFYSHGANNAKGVCIIIDKSLPYRVVKTESDSEGRIVCCEFENIDDPTKRLTICNVYGPNVDNPSFYMQAYLMASSMAPETILIGDFNLVMNVKLDRRSSTMNKHKSREFLENVCEEANMTEIWRDRNPEEKLYSWMRTKPRIQASRIDFALTTYGVANAVLNTMYLAGIQSDHMAFYISIDMIGNPRGPGYWKFNNLLLNDDGYIKDLNCLISKTKWDSILKGHKDRWCYLKREIIQKSKNYAKNKAKEKELIISQLSDKIIELQHQVSSEDNPKTEDIDLLLKSKADIEELLQEKTRGIIFRSKTRWLENEGTSSKYFLNMEKRRYNSRTCARVVKKDGSITTNFEEILKEQENFYRNLYTANNDVIFDVGKQYRN